MEEDYKKEVDALALAFSEACLDRGGATYAEEAIVQFFTDVIVGAAEHLGCAFGYGHLGDDPYAWALWMLKGEATWPVDHQEGVEPLWVTLRRAIGRRYGKMPVEGATAGTEEVTDG